MRLVYLGQSTANAREGREMAVIGIPIAILTNVSKTNQSNLESMVEWLICNKNSQSQHDDTYMRNFEIL